MAFYNGGLVVAVMGLDPCTEALRRAVDATKLLYHV